jgi:hypothetical protein
VDVVNQASPSFGFRELLDVLMNTDVSNEKIEIFLNKDVDGSGSVREHVTARMTNEVMASLGQPSHLKSKDVKRVEQLMKEGNAPSQTDKDILDVKELPKKNS